MKRPIIQNIFRVLILVTSAIIINSCIVVDIKKAGVFKEPVEYDNRSTAYINIPEGIYKRENLQYLTDQEKDGSKIRFSYLGHCSGGGISFSGIMLPIIPIPYYSSNTCEKEGFLVSHQTIADTLGVTLQLYYNGITYSPYIDKGSIKFKISNFSEFKKASDKTLIIHKRKPDGKIFTKELPFDWKIVVETSGGL